MSAVGRRCGCGHCENAILEIDVLCWECQNITERQSASLRPFVCARSITLNSVEKEIHEVHLFTAFLPPFPRSVELAENFWSELAFASLFTQYF
jgi:hypothetical protein